MNDARYRLMQGDCLKLLPTLEPESVDLVVADLPYGLTANKWDSVIPFAPLWEHLRRVGTATAAFLFTASQPFSSALVLSNPREFRHEWIWRKERGGNFANTVREPFKEHESVLVFSRGKWTYHPQMQARAAGGLARVRHDFQSSAPSENYRSFQREGRHRLSTLRVPSSVQDFTVDHGVHPTQKPVALMAYLIRTYSDPDDVILDPCMGSGTTGVAALGEGRRFVGMETDPEYFATATRRILSTTPPLLYQEEVS
jgi:site-specific DNA-methyltransferase (adenine-specific)